MTCLDDARLALLDPDRDLRGAALEVCVSLRHAQQILTDQMTGHSPERVEPGR